MPKSKAPRKKQKTKSQDEKAEENKAYSQHCLHLEFNNLLRTITVRASLWKDDCLRYLRDFCHVVSTHPCIFPAMMGDSNEELTPHSHDEDEIVARTNGYIAAIAAGEDTSELTSQPILSVLSRKTGFHDVLQPDNEIAKNHQKVKLTHLTLVDGDNNQIHARMATHIADAGRLLGEGDVLRLELYVELTYHVNDTSQSMPALFIIRYTRVGRIPMPLQSDIKDMIPYSPSHSALQQTGQRKSSSPIIDPLTQDPPACTYENRLCRKFGVNFIGRCICEEIKVEERDLNVIAEDCHLINKPASELTENKPKRLVLYWWYATNIYSLTGKGNRGKLPDCLEYAIKKAYPEADSSGWTGYTPGSTRKRKTG